MEIPDNEWVKLKNGNWIKFIPTDWKLKSKNLAKGVKLTVT